MKISWRAVNLARMIPMLIFGMLAGVVADRVDKRKLLLVANAFTFLNKAVLAALILTGQIEVWHVMLTAFLMGSSMAFEQPTRIAIIPILVKGEMLNSAIALNSAAMNVTRIIGPAGAGLLLAPIGVGGVYATAAGVYLLTMAANFLMRVPREDHSIGERKSMWSDMTEGMKYVYTEKRVFLMILLTLVPIILAWPYQTLLVIFADDVLHTGGAGYGFLQMWSGVGALMSVFVIASLRQVKRKGLMTMGSAVMFGALLVVFSQSTNVPLSNALMVGVGFMSTAVMILTNTVLLTVAPPELHGRVMGLYRLDRGLQPFGMMVFGAMADGIGAPVTTLIMGVSTILSVVIMALAVPVARRIE